MSVETELDSFYDAIADGGEYYLHMMGAAYLRKTKIPVRRVCLCHIETTDGRDIYWFADKKDIDLGLDNDNAD